MTTTTLDRQKADASARSALEQQLATLAGQLEKLEAQVRQAQQVASLGTTALVMAHEFRGLLTPLMNYVRTALDTGDPTLTRKALEVTYRDGRILADMACRVEQVGAAKRAEPQITAVREAVEAGADTLCRPLSKDNIIFKNEVAADLTAWADPLHLHQVFFNLFVNAREAMLEQRSGTLRVTAARTGDTVEIRVSDKGKGIEPDMIGEVFEAFKTTRPATNGKARCGGMGLSLCRELIEKSGGTIRVESEVGKGTTFFITLPAGEPTSLQET